jgi:hypothetical protein
VVLDVALSFPIEFNGISEMDFWLVQAMDAVKEGEDAFQKLGCALEALPKLGGSLAALQTPSPCADPVAKATVPSTGACTSAILPQSLGQSSSSSEAEETVDPNFTVTRSQDRMLKRVNDIGVKSLPTTLEAVANGLIQHLDQAGFSSVNAEGASLLELMTSCVASLFMLQVCCRKLYSNHRSIVKLTTRSKHGDDIKELDSEWPVDVLCLVIKNMLNELGFWPQSYHVHMIEMTAMLQNAWKIVLIWCTTQKRVSCVCFGSADTVIFEFSW